jgi:hypothetical protein
MRNVLAHAGRQGRRVVAALIGTAFFQDDAEAASPAPHKQRSTHAERISQQVEHTSEIAIGLFAAAWNATG